MPHALRRRKRSGSSESLHFRLGTPSFPQARLPLHEVPDTTQRSRGFVSEVQIARTYAKLDRDEGEQGERRLIPRLLPKTKSPRLSRGGSQSRYNAKREVRVHIRPSVAATINFSWPLASLFFSRDLTAISGFATT